MQETVVDLYDCAEKSSAVFTNGSLSKKWKKRGVDAKFWHKACSMANSLDALNFNKFAEGQPNAIDRKYAGG